MEPYNPLSRVNLGASVERALLQQACGPLPPGEFRGAGIYAIYYHGDFPAYRPVSSLTCEVPIYVGKAVPLGARRGKTGLGVDPGLVLYNRIKQHAKSIEAAANLRLDDFSCRYVVVEDIWIPLGESLVIRHYKPLWNVGPVDGFGNHDPGAGRRNQERSAWDVLHPGRAWATTLPATRQPEDVLEAIRGYFAGEVPATDDLTADGEGAEE